MVGACCVPHCKSTKKSVGVTLHKFTSDKTLMKVWIHNIKRDTHPSKRNPYPFKVDKNTRICSLHFEKKFRIINSQHSYLTKDAIPTIFDWTITKCRSSTEKISKYFEANRESLGTIKPKNCNSSNSTDQDSVDGKNENDVSDEYRTKYEADTTPLDKNPQETILQESTLPHVNYEILYNELLQMFSALDEKYTELSELHSKCIKTTVKESKTTQTDCKTYVQADINVVTPFYTSVSLLGNGLFSWKFFESNENLLFFYTGFVDLESFQCSFDMLFYFKQASVNIVRMHYNSGSEQEFDNLKLSRQDQYLLFLMKLRQGFVYEHLKTLFQVSLGTVANVFITWINFVYIRLASIDYWVHRDTLLENAVPDVHTKYKNVMGNLDCTELFIQAPSSLVRQSQTFSNHKSHNTLKALIVSDMNGGILFASSLLTGSISDNKIVIDSGFVDLVKNKIAAGFLQAGDVFLADKGFTAHNLISGVTINIPVFRIADTQFSAQEVCINQTISHERIHVERTIGRVKSYKILQQTIPISLMGSINQIWTICCILSNFRNPLRQNVDPKRTD